MNIDVYQYAQQIAQQHYGNKKYIIEPVQLRMQDLDYRNNAFKNIHMQNIYVGLAQWQPGFNTYIKLVVDGDKYDPVAKNFEWKTWGITYRRFENTGTDFESDYYHEYITSIMVLKAAIIAYPKQTASDLSGNPPHSWPFVGYVIKPQ